jgi:hypothetical protein
LIVNVDFVLHRDRVPQPGSGSNLGPPRLAGVRPAARVGQPGSVFSGSVRVGSPVPRDPGLVSRHLKVAATVHRRIPSVGNHSTRDTRADHHHQPSQTLAL